MKKKLKEVFLRVINEAESRNVDLRTAASILAIERIERTYVQRGVYPYKKLLKMKYGNLIIEENEFLILEKLLKLNHIDKTNTIKSHILKLQEELRNAIIVAENKMPKDIIRLNSVVTVASQDGLWIKTFKLVLPSESNILENKISLLLPMGTAVLGYAKEDTILWNFPGGLKELKVLDVVQAPKSVLK